MKRKHFIKGLLLAPLGLLAGSTAEIKGNVRDCAGSSVEAKAGEKGMKERMEALEFRVSENEQEIIRLWEHWIDLFGRPADADAEGVLPQSGKRTQTRKS